MMKQTMKQSVKIGFMSLLLMFVSLMSLFASQAHVIYEVDWVSEEAGVVTLKWSHESVTTPIMIQSWSQNTEGDVIIRYTSGSTVPVGFSERRIEVNSLKTPFNIVLLEARADAEIPVFSDMPDETEASKAIQMLYDLGVLNGYTDGTIKPSQSVSRAEFSKMLYMATGMTTESSSGFTDVATTHWAQEYIYTLAAKGIVQGKGQGRFDPNGTITIGELATILSRTFTLYSDDEPYPYTSNGHWSFGYFNQLVRQGVIQSTDTYYYPYQADRLATRQECAILLSRILLEYHEVAQ